MGIGITSNDGKNMINSIRGGGAALASVRHLLPLPVSVGARTRRGHGTQQAEQGRRFAAAATFRAAAAVAASAAVVA